MAGLVDVNYHTSCTQSGNRHCRCKSEWAECMKESKKLGDSGRE